MEKVTEYLNKLPLFQYISQRTQVQPKFLAVGIAILAFITVQNSSLGPIFANIILLILPIRDALLELRSKNPRPAELRRHLIVLVLFSFSSLLDGLGIPRIIPLFSIAKLVFILWTRSSDSNANWVHENILAHIPVEDDRLSSTLEDAGARARAAVSEQVEIKKKQK